MDAWESQQPSYQPTLLVLQHLDAALNEYSGAPPPTASAAAQEQPLLLADAHADAAVARAADAGMASASGEGSSEEEGGGSREQQQGASSGERAEQAGARDDAASGRQQGGASGSGRRGAEGAREEGTPPARVRVMLLCGADMVESLVVPGVWRPEHIRAILGDHGIVCIDRCALVSPHACQKTSICPSP